MQINYLFYLPKYVIVVPPIVVVFQNACVPSTIRAPHLNVPDTFVVPETTRVAHLIPSELSLVITDVDNLSAWRYEIFAFAAFKLPIVA